MTNEIGKSNVNANLTRFEYNKPTANARKFSRAPAVINAGRRGSCGATERLHGDFDLAGNASQRTVLQSPVMERAMLLPSMSARPGR